METSGGGEGHENGPGEDARPRRGRWVGVRGGPGGMDHLDPHTRSEVERAMAERAARRGRLLAEVHVRVFEEDCETQVGFPPGAAFDVDSDPAQIAAAVARARDALGNWR